MRALMKTFVGITVGTILLMVGPTGASVASASESDPDPTSAVSHNLGGSLEGLYTDAAGGEFSGSDQIVVVIDGAFPAGNSQFIDSAGQTKIAGEACIGQPVGTTPWPSLCNSNSTLHPGWPNGDPMYFTEGAGASEPGNAPFNACAEADGDYCHSWHGTTAAGAVVGQPSTRYELDGRVHRAAGAAAGAQVFQIKIGGGTGTARGWPHASVVDALDWVNYELSQRIGYNGEIAAVTLSVSGGPLPTGSVCPAGGDAIDSAAGRLKSQGIPVIMSAGNDGIDGTGTWNCGANIVRAGAVNVTSDTLTTYTQRSTATQLYAPVGDGVFADDNKIMLPYRDSGWTFVDGTSFAAPQLAGAYAVLREKFGSAPTVDQLTGMLHESGRPVTGQGAPAGSRVIDVSAALDAAP